MIVRIPTISVILMLSSTLQADDFDICKDTVIDTETEQAYGPHGIPYTGKIACYRDKDNKILKSTRAFDKGSPIGQHICYSQSGEKASYVSYNKTKVRKLGVFTNKKPSTTASTTPSFWQPKVQCSSGIPEDCWAERWECSQGEQSCAFVCR